MTSHGHVVFFFPFQVSLIIFKMSKFSCYNINNSSKTAKRSFQSLGRFRIFVLLEGYILAPYSYMFCGSCTMFYMWIWLWIIDTQLCMTKLYVIFFFFFGEIKRVREKLSEMGKKLFLFFCG